VSWLTAIFRRFLLPALIGAYLANFAVYALLGSEGAATDWQSIGVLFAIILAGLIAGWPIFNLLRRQRLAAPVLAMLILALGTGLGVLAAYLIALRLVPDTAGDYAFFGLAVGPVAALLWLIINFDVLRAGTARQWGD
jgi:hypothetical protein